MAGTMKLYEIPAAYEALWQQVETEAVDGEIDAELNEQLAAIEDEFHTKAENLVKVVRSLEASAATCKEEAKRLTERARTTANKVDWLKGYLFDQMQAIGCDRVNSDLFAITLAKKPPRCHIVDEDLISDVYFAAQDPKLLKAEVLKALKAGDDVSGAELVTGEQTLRIK